VTYRRHVLFSGRGLATHLFVKTTDARVHSPVPAGTSEQRALCARKRRTRDCRHTSLAVRPLCPRSVGATLPAARCGHRRPAEAAYRARKDALTEPAAMPVGESAPACYRPKSHLRHPVDNGNRFAFCVPCVRCLTIAGGRLGYLMACKYPIHIPPIHDWPRPNSGAFLFRLGLSRAVQHCRVGGGGGVAGAGMAVGAARSQPPEGSQSPQRMIQERAACTSQALVRSAVAAGRRGPRRT
jgi:hypothetical protein